MSFKADFESHVNQVNDGIFVNHGSIIEAQLIYAAQPFDTWDKKFDLVLRLKIGEKGVDFERRITLFGDYKWNEDKTVKSDHSAFRIMQVFRDLSEAGHIDGYGADANGRITKDGTPINANTPVTLSDWAGKPVSTLSYKATWKNGKVGYSTYRYVAVDTNHSGEDAVEARLKAAFLKEVKGGYVKDYTPDAVKETAASGGADGPDDDLPF